MEAEFIEIHAFLAKHPPFSALPVTAQQEAARQITIRYYPSGSEILSFGDEIRDLYIIRSGVVEIYRREGELYNRLTEGKLFGQFSLLTNNSVRLPAKALEDSLIYCLPKRTFSDFCTRFAEFADFVEVNDSTRLHNAVETILDRNHLTTAKVSTLLQREPVRLPPTATVRDAAKMLATEKVTSLLINSADNEQANEEKPAGIITERDLCIKVLAAGLPPDTSVKDIMSTNIISLNHNAYFFEALLFMLKHKVYHLPVMHGDLALGIIELTDIVRYESQHSLLLVSNLFLQNSVKDLARLSLQVKDCFQHMVNEDANSHMIGTALAVIGRSFKQRLLELAEKTLGPPPVPYCFLALGSMARDEQLIVTGQNNALILDDSYLPEEHYGYFDALSNFVCDGMAACGYKYCTHNIMASNPQWRKTLSEWQACFTDWIDHPQASELKVNSIVFDIEGVWGQTDWAEELRTYVVTRASNNRHFLTSLARSALSQTPPLGFFRNFVMEKDGRQDNSINLKRRGTAPLANLIRVHALAAGSLARNSFERLADLIDKDLLPKGQGPDLRDAMEFISIVRIRHHALYIASHREPDNNIAPENLSDFECRNLKDAFQILSNAQNYIKYRYHTSRSN